MNKLETLIIPQPSSLMEKISSLINKKTDIVSVEIFSEKLSPSKISCAELPYLIALYSGVPLNTVLSWPGCPSSNVLQISYDTYNLELGLVQQELKTLDECGLFVSSTLPDSFINVKRILAKYYSVMDIKLETLNLKDLDKRDIKLVHDALNLKDLDKRDINSLVIVYHLLMRYGINTTFVMRKDRIPNPPAYLLYTNVKTVPIGVVKIDHIKTVEHVICNYLLCPDESFNFIAEYTCPF